MAGASSPSPAPSLEAVRPLGLCGLLCRGPGGAAEGRLRRLAGSLRRHRAAALHRVSAGPLTAGVLVTGGSGAAWCAVDGEVAVVSHSRLLGRHTGTTDAPRLAAAWRRWGVEMPTHLDGDFAFALWDGEHRQLFAARDPAAARPFVYAELGGDLLFASDPAALLADPAVDRAPDLRALADFLVLDLHPDGRTAWAAIRRLPPGHRLLWQEGGPARVERWWRPETVTPLQRRSDEVHAERFSQLLAHVVEERLAVTAGRPAVLLSGGVDSSSVAALAAAAAPPGRPPLALTHTCPRFPQCDESAYARAVVVHTGLDLVTVSAERKLLPTSLLGLADQEPWTAGQLPFASLLFERAAAAGAGPVLTGFGGDSLFDAARWRYRDDARSGRWWRLTPWLRARRRAGASWPEALAGVLVKPLLPRPWLTVLDRRRSVWHRRQIPPWMPSAATRRTGVAERLTARRLPHRFRGVRQLQFEHLVGLAQQAVALEGMEVCAAGHGLEVFHPLLDRRVAEHVLALPLQLGARPGAAGSKWLLRAALGHRLPDEVRHRGDKTGWGPSLAHQLRGAVGDRLHALFHDSRCAGLGLVDDAALRRELTRFRRGEGPYGHGLLFLPPLLVELWLRAGGAG